MTVRTVVRLVCLGRPDQPLQATPHDGQWLVDYDPTRPGAGPEEGPMLAHLVTTADRARARVFESSRDLMDYLWKPSGMPGPGGRPHRPIMAYTLMTEPE